MHGTREDRERLFSNIVDTELRQELLEKLPQLSPEERAAWDWDAGGVDVGSAAGDLWSFRRLFQSPVKYTWTGLGGMVWRV